MSADENLVPCYVRAWVDEVVPAPIEDGSKQLELPLGALPQGGLRPLNVEKVGYSRMLSCLYPSERATSVVSHVVSNGVNGYEHAPLLYFLTPSTIPPAWFSVTFVARSPDMVNTSRTLGSNPTPNVSLP